MCRTGETSQQQPALLRPPAHHDDVRPALLFDPAEHFVPISEHLHDVRLAGKLRGGEAPCMELRERDADHADHALAIDQESLHERFGARWTGVVEDPVFTHWTILFTASLSPSGPSTSAWAPYCNTSRTPNAGSAT